MLGCTGRGGRWCQISIYVIARDVFFSLETRSRVEFVVLGVGFFLTNLLDLAGALALGALVAMALGSAEIADGVSRVTSAIGFTGSSFALLVSAIVSLFFVKILLSVAVTFRYARYLRELEARGFSRMVRHFSSGDLERLQASPRAETLWALRSSASVIYGTVLGALVFLLADFLSAFVTFVVLVGFDPVAATLISTYFLSVGFLYQRIVRPRISQVSSDLIDSSIATGKWSHDLLEGFREIVVSNHARKYAMLFERTRDQALGAISRERMLGIFPRLFVELSLILGVVVVVLWLYQSGGLVDNLVVLAVFVVGGLKLVGALLPIQSRVATILTAAEQCSKALDWQRVALRSNEGGHIGSFEVLPKHKVRKNLSFHHVTFAYGSAPPVVQDLSFTLNGPGLFSLSGPSGAGKTTIGNLGLGLLSPDSGQIELLGQNPVLLRGQSMIPVSVVPQRMVAFSGTIARNVALGVDDSEINYERIEFLLERLQILEPINALPHGINSELAGHFDLLSGGQYQRLALARAFYSQPLFLLLDESTNALDVESKRLVLDFVIEQSEHALILAINHDEDFQRLSRTQLRMVNGRIETFSA